MIQSKSKADQLNLAGKLAKTFLHSKLTLLIIIGSLLYGALAIVFTPRTYNPEIVVPVINISISRPGSSSEEMLNQVVRPLEALMSSIPGVDHTYGTAMNDSGIVTVRFKVNENEESSLVKVYNQINSNMNRMPSGTLMPLVQSVSLYDVPLVTISLSSDSMSESELHHYATLLLEQLRTVPRVGKSWIAGSSPTAVKVWLMPEKLSKFNIPLDQIKKSLLANNSAFNAGKIEPGLRDVPIRISAELTNIEDVKRVIIGVYNGKPVYLSDVATIALSAEDDDVHSYYADGAASNNHSQIGRYVPSATLALARQKGSNGVVVADAILSKLNDVKARILPPDLKVNITRNYGEDANEAVNTLIEHLGIAIGAVVIILMLFLGWREASVVIFSIPLILFLVLGIGWLFGQTINRITLFALILSLGLLVDDSIVVIENIHRHIIHHPIRNFGRLVVRAADEIGKPTIVATFTVILALIPMAFVTGMMGPFMGPIPFNAPLAMIVSLLIAYTVVPYLAYRWLKTKARSVYESSHTGSHDGKHENGKNNKLQNLYRQIFHPLMTSSKRRHTFYAVVFALLVLAMLQPAWQFLRPSGTNGPLSFFGVELKMLPDDNVNTFLIELDGQAGVPGKYIKEAADRIGDVLGKNKYIQDYQLYMGESSPEDFAAMVRGDAFNHGPQYAQIRVNLINKHKRNIGSHQIAQQVYADLAGIRDTYTKLNVKLFETPPGPPVRSQMEAALFGPDYHLLRSLGDKVTTDVYPHIYGMINIDNSVSLNLQEYQVWVDQQAAVLAGLSPSLLASDIKTYFSGDPVGSIHHPDARDPLNIILKLPASSRTSLEVLNNLTILNRQSIAIPLASVVKFNQVIQDKPIYTRDQHPVVYVTGEMLYSSPVYAVTTATKLINHHQLLPNTPVNVGNLGFAEAQPSSASQYQMFWLGEMRLTLDVFRDLGTAFIVAIMLIYLLLTGFYRSFMIPLVIMGAIPLTIIGVFPGHWLLNQPFTATSMIGVIALAGIVVRNSLLLIDFILERQKQGYSVEVAVLESGVVRLMPILLTALAIILGSAVMISDPVFGGLAISLIFGAFASTTLTLFVIPLIYLSWWRRRLRKMNLTIK